MKCRKQEDKEMKNRMKKTGGIAVLTAGCMMVMMPVAHAYVDPSATTYLLQAIAGIVIAAGSVGMISGAGRRKS